MLAMNLLCIILVCCMSAVLPASCSACAAIVSSAKTTHNIVPDCCGDINNKEAFLDEVLAELRSNSTLLLCPGEHTIRNFSLIRDLTNVSIKGIAGSGATVTCQEDVGLAFFNISHLQIENVDIIGCGMRHNATVTVETVLSTTLDMFFWIPSETKIAVLVGNCANVVFTNVTIADTSGLGLVGINVMGNSVLKGTHFINNTYAVCGYVLSRKNPIGADPGLLNKQGGGGAFLLYHNYRQQEDNLYGDANLAITDSAFIGNKECSPASTVELFYVHSTGFEEFNYMVGGGGGLTVMLAQSSYQVSVAVKHSEFVRNLAKWGSGANIGIFNTAMNFLVKFLNCSFIKNGVEPTGVYQSKYFIKGGSGMAVINDVVDPNSPRPVLGRKNGSVVIEGSKFLQNVAHKGSGLLVYSIYAAVAVGGSYRDTTHVHCINSTFKFNVGAIGPAIHAYEFKRAARSQVPGMLLGLTDVNIVDNIVSPLSGSLFRLLHDSSGAVHIRSMNVIFWGRCSVERNQGTGVYGRDSIFYVSRNSHINIVGNTGTFGGGMSLHSWTMLVLQSSSSLTFLNNTGIVSGGALYVRMNDDAALSYTDCFIRLLNRNYYSCNNFGGCDKLSEMDIRLEFSGNQAPIGSTMFGSSLATCGWVHELKHKRSFSGNLSTLAFLQHSLPKMFHFDNAPNGIAEVSTQAVHLSASNVSFSAVPGQTLKLSIHAMDRLSQHAPAIITSTITSDHNANAQIGSSGYRLVSESANNEVPLKVSGQIGDVVTIAIYSIESYADTQLNVTLLDCSPGFVYSEDTMTCVCDPELMSRDIVCDTETVALTVPNRMWIGPGHVGDKIDLVEVCVLDYCQPGAKTIVQQDNDCFESQCNSGYHRTGLLCGECKDGYSVAFGTNKCLQCSNVYLLLIIVFIVAGILLVLGISLLHITVTKGYLNAVLLYCNVISVYSGYFTSGSPTIFVLSSFLNVSVGIELCFFHGMNSLVRVGLQLAFPAYLFLLIGLVIRLARTKLFRWLARPPLDAVQMFGTLLVLCYSSVLESCIEILGVIHMHTLSGESLVRWVVDPTVPYFRGWHGLLGSIAVLLVVLYTSIFPLMLMFPISWIKRLPCIGRYISRIDPLFDALYGPFTIKARPWLGVRLLLRIFPLVFVFFTEFPLNVFLLAIFLLSLLYVQLMIRPFKSTLVHAVDNLLIANAALLSLGALYFEVDTHSEAVANGYTYSLVFIAYSIFAAIFVYYIIARCSKNQRVKNLYSRLLRHVPFLKETSNNYHDIFNTVPPKPKKAVTTTVVDLVELRAPLE